MKYIFSLEKVACIRLAGSLGIIGACLFLAGICVGLAVSHGKDSEGTALQAIAAPSTGEVKTLKPSAPTTQPVKHENQNGGAQVALVNAESGIDHQFSSPLSESSVLNAQMNSSNEQYSETGLALNPRIDQPIEHQFARGKNATVWPLDPGTIPDSSDTRVSRAYTSQTAMKDMTVQARVKNDEMRLPRQRQPKEVVENGQSQAVPASLPSRPEATLRGPYFLQVGTFLNSAEAQARGMELRRKGYSTFVMTRRDLKNRMWFQVGIGGFLNRKAAAQAAHQFKEEERLPALIRKKSSYLFHAL